MIEPEGPLIGNEGSKGKFDVAQALGSHSLYAFRVRFSDREGRCFITASEAGRLSQLTTEWVGRALANLSARHGDTWLKRSLLSDGGLQLHAEDASDLPARRSKV